MPIITKSLNFAPSLINVEPASPFYPEGAAYRSNNLRLDEDNCWRKGPSLNNTKIAGEDERAAVGNIVKASNNTLFTCLGGTVTGGAGSALAEPSISVSVSGSLIGTRQEGGIYYYMAINYDPVNNIESLPSAVIEHWVRRYYSGDIRQPDVPVLSGGDTNTKWYRSKVIKIHKGDTMQLGSNSPIEFYFIGSGTDLNDYAHDSEIANPENLYKGRGSFRPTSGVDAMGSFNNRMFYFVDNIAYFSSAGRPEEVPQEYTLTITTSYSAGAWVGEVLTAGSGSITLTRKPLLDTGLYAPAKMAILELVGRTVVRAEAINGKLWVWTTNSMGYIIPTDNLEGFRYVHVAEGFGLNGAWTLAVTPYGIFGADESGIWLFTDRPRRLNTGKIDVFDSNKDTYIDSFSTNIGMWVGELNEYWLSCSGKQIVYQADSERFVGPYNLGVTLNAAYLGGLFQTHLVRSSTTPILNTRDATEATLQFWMGQSAPTIIKDQVAVEALHSESTASALNLYQNIIASTVGANSPAEVSYESSSGKIVGDSSGRFFMVQIVLSIGAVVAVNYRYNQAAETLGV